MDPETLIANFNWRSNPFILKDLQLNPPRPCRFSFLFFGLPPLNRDAPAEGAGLPTAGYGSKISRRDRARCRPPQGRPMLKLPAERLVAEAAGELVIAAC